MRMCFLAHGSSIHTRRWMKYFLDRGHDLSLITFTPEIMTDGIQVLALRPLLPIAYERANWHYLLRLTKLRRLLRTIQPDLICAHFVSSYGFMAALTPHAACPLVVCIQGSDLLVFPKKSPIHARLTRFALNRADLIILPGAHMQGELVGHIGSHKPVLTIQYGIDIRWFHPDESHSHITKPVCFSNRAMVPLSGVETILEAAAILKSLGSPLRFFLADARGRQSIPFQKRAKELQLRDSVVFEGRIDHRQMPSALLRASIYVSMAPSDGASISLMEAMACGLFPVVSDIPANREWVADGVNGFLAPVGRPDILAEKLQAGWGNEPLRREAMVRNWEQIRTRGEYFQNMEEIEAAFLRLTNR